MKVFISWSGTVSHQCALVLRDWLPSVIQSIQPYVSSEDIDKGARWSTDIAGELHHASYGLICLTSSNIAAPWINFEAGALGKSIDKSRVSPFLFRMKRSDVVGPLIQFQTTIFEKEDVCKLLRSINEACGQDTLDEVRLLRTFEVWWPQLKDKLDAIPEDPVQVPLLAAPPSAPVDDDQTSRVLEEILELTRNNHKILRSPDAILPEKYLEHVLRRYGRPGSALELADLGGSDAFVDLMNGYSELTRFLTSPEVSKALKLAESETGPLTVSLRHRLRDIDRPIRHLGRRLGLSVPTLRFRLAEEPDSGS